MKVIQVSLEDDLLVALDERLRAVGVARSAFVRDAVARELRRQITEEKDRRYRHGYEKFPIEPGEFDLEVDDENWPEW